MISAPKKSQIELCLIALLCLLTLETANRPGRFPTNVNRSAVGYSTGVAIRKVLHWPSSAKSATTAGSPRPDPRRGDGISGGRQHARGLLECGARRSMSPPGGDAVQTPGNTYGRILAGWSSTDATGRPVDLTALSYTGVKSLLGGLMTDHTRRDDERSIPKPIPLEVGLQVPRDLRAEAAPEGAVRRTAAAVEGDLPRTWPGKRSARFWKAI